MDIKKGAPVGAPKESYQTNLTLGGGESGMRGVTHQAQYLYCKADANFISLQLYTKNGLTTRIVKKLTGKLVNKSH